MALIKKGHIKQLEKDRIYIHKTTEATYSVFTDGGEKFFQIDTYGSEGRQLKDKVSQSIQFDKESALELVGILINEFIL